MKKLITAFLISAILVTPAWAARKRSYSGSSESSGKRLGNIGVNYSLENAWGLHAEFNLQHPLSLQIFLKSYTRDYLFGGWGSDNYTALGAALLYDFARDARLHPYMGLGAYNVNAAYNSSGTTASAPVSGGLYLTAGIRFALTPAVDLDANYNNFGGITLGGNFKF